MHEARKATKKSRAVLRLVRDEIGSKTYARENAALRDAARRLSAPRDATVLVDAVDRLGRQVPLARRSLAPLTAVLTERRDEVAKRVLHDEGAMTAAAGELAEIRGRITSLEVGTDRFSALEGGLKRTYSRGRNAFADARKKPTDERSARVAQAGQGPLVPRARAPGRLAGAHGRARGRHRQAG